MMMEDKASRRTVFIGIQARFVLTFTLAFLVVLAVVFFWVRGFVFMLVFDNIKSDLLAIVETAATDIDSQGHERLVTQGAMDDADYLDANAKLRSVKYTNPKAAGMYTYVQLSGEPSQIRLIVSAAVPPGEEANARDLALSVARFPGCLVDPSSRPTLRTAYEPPPEIRADFLRGLTEPAVTSDVYSDAWGTWLSAFAPILDEAGQPVGAVGVDMCVADVIAVQSRVLRTLALVFGGVFVVLAALVYAGAYNLTRPIQKLTIAADRIAQGDYHQDVSKLYGGRLEDEVSKLARVFEWMVSQVREREENLKQQVTELQILIDESRKEQQVQEIVDTDFFRDLREKARDVRSRTKRP